MARLDVVIRNLTDLEELTITVSDATSIREIKEILAQMAERPELLEVGEILKINNDGSTQVVKDRKLLSMVCSERNRTLGFRGCPLHPPPFVPSTLSLEDFAEFDPEEDVLGSPRSIRACTLEGVNPEDLIYVPLTDYTSDRVEPRIGELWYDFFEALRQDTLKACRETRQMLIDEEDPKSPIKTRLRPEAHRIAGTGGNYCGALEHSKNDNVLKFFLERNEMCHIDRVYKGATKPFKPNLKGSRYFSNAATFHDEDPVLAGDGADQASDKLGEMLKYYHRLPNAKKFVPEQRFITRSKGCQQYEADTRKLHNDQSEMRRLNDARVECAEWQIAVVDGNIQERNATRREMDEMNAKSKPIKTKLERIRRVAIDKRAAYFQERRDAVHESQLDYQYHRCDEDNRITLRDQAVQERVHQHKDMKMLAFAREWTKRRVRWQLNNNSITANRDAWNQSTMDREQAATERVDCQRMIQQKWIEYRREIKALKRTYADLSKTRESARQGARKEAVAAEFGRMAIEVALPSPSPNRRKHFAEALSLANKSAGAHSHSQSTSTMQTMSCQLNSRDLANAAPFSHLLTQPRVVKRIGRFEFPRMPGSQFGSSMGSTRSGNMSIGGGSSNVRHSTSMPSLNNSVMDH